MRKRKPSRQPGSFAGYVCFCLGAYARATFARAFEEDEQVRRARLLGEAIDLLRGELHPEHAEALIDNSADVVSSAKGVLNRTRALPELEPSGAFISRLTEAISA